MRRQLTRADHRLAQPRPLPDPATPGSFFSCRYVLFDHDSRFTATVAGHPRIVKIASGKLVDPIDTGSYPLGVKTAMTWQELPGSHAPGERLLFHSDGPTEARNANEREFGERHQPAGTTQPRPPRSSANGPCSQVDACGKMMCRSR
jgi:hypothetical protein